MKSLILISLLFFPILNGISSTTSSAESSAHYLAKNNKKFVQNVWSEISKELEINEPFFYPYNEYGVGFNVETYDYEEKLFVEQSNSIKTNLFNIIFKHILFGDLIPYFPYDPNWYDTKDKGFFYYPLIEKPKNSKSNLNYFNDSVFREKIRSSGFLGYKEYRSYVAIQSVSWPGEDSIDANGNVVYYEMPYVWYVDKNIIGYQLREELILNQEGHTLSRKIKAIAPIVINPEYSGKSEGKSLLFWINFEEFEPILKKYFVITSSAEKQKIKSFKQIFDERIFIATTVEHDSTYVRPSK